MLHVTSPRSRVPSPLWFLACSLFFVLYSNYAQTEETANNNRLEIFLDGLETYSAEFEQVLFNESGTMLETSTGSMYLKQPGSFHWAYRHPYTQLLISNGSTLWIYDQDLEQVMINDVGNTLEQTPAAILAGDVDVDQEYIVVEMGNIDNIDWIELTSRDIESQFNSLRFGFRGTTLAGMILFDNLGQTTRISFIQAERNPVLDNTLFEFTIPVDTDVIDNRE